MIMVMIVVNTFCCGFPVLGSAILPGPLPQAPRSPSRWPRPARRRWQRLLVRLGEAAWLLL